MVEFIKIEKYILLKYSPLNGAEWLLRIFDVIPTDENEVIKKSDEYCIKRTFNLTKISYLKAEEIFKNNEGVTFEEDYVDNICFVFAELIGDYYVINQEILDINFQLYFHKDIELKLKYFLQYNNISVFGKINDVFNDEILCIGGENEKLSLEGFENIIRKFPNSKEILKYVHARISSFLRNEFDSIPDYVKEYEEFLNRKLSKSFESKKNYRKIIENNEKIKFDIYYKKLKEMYSNYESYSENDWQLQIIEIFKLLYPKYIKVIPKVSINDYFSNSKREIDIMLIDASGYVDIVEIKKPKSCGVLYKSKYRNNYVPVRELQGAVIQIENYILSLTKMSSQKEKSFVGKYSEKLPNDLKIRIINPKGIVIYGLEKEMDKKQMNDFEIVKRMYSKVVDIITYDELLRRLENIRDSFC